MTKLPWRRLALLPVAGFLLLSACDDLKLGWPNFDDSGGGSGSGTAFAQTGGIEYVASFLCGSNPSGLQDPVLSGQYGTLINIYNPTGGVITVTMRTSQSIPPGGLRTGELSNFVTRNIDSFRALEVDCQTIASEFTGGTASLLTSGVIVIQSSTSVEVVATYTAGGTGTISSIHVETITAR